MRQLTSLLKLIVFLGALTVSSNVISDSPPVPDKSSQFDYQATLKYSQEVIGKTVGEYTFTDSNGPTVSLAQFRGKPLIVSLIYTSCYHTCPMTTKQLARVVQIAQAALGNNSFNVATIGFDALQDTPQTMHYFATTQGINLDHWYFLSTTAETIKALTKDLGFTYFPSPRGYDHIVQATVIDAKGKIYQQVYGEVFAPPLLVEPLKQLILGRFSPQQPLLTDLINKVRFFCTTYDPSRDAYHFDYSIFVGLLIGASILISVGIFLVREFFRTRPSPPS